MELIVLVVLAAVLMAEGIVPLTPCGRLLLVTPKYPSAHECALFKSPDTAAAKIVFLHMPFSSRLGQTRPMNTPVTISGTMIGIEGNSLTFS